jgi:hypothetical protein
MTKTSQIVKPSTRETALTPWDACDEASARLDAVFAIFEWLETHDDPTGFVLDSARKMLTDLQADLRASGESWHESPLNTFRSDGRCAGLRRVLCEAVATSFAGREPRRRPGNLSGSCERTAPVDRLRRRS